MNFTHFSLELKGPVPLAQVDHLQGFKGYNLNPKNLFKSLRSMICLENPIVEKSFLELISNDKKHYKLNIFCYVGFLKFEVTNMHTTLMTTFQ